MKPHSQWSEALVATSRITDKLGKHVDAGIVSLVAALRMLGFPTSGSCEGHIDRGRGYPFVDIYAPSPIACATFADLTAAEKDFVRAQAIAHRVRMLHLLDEFYSLPKPHENGSHLLGRLLPGPSESWSTWHSGNTGFSLYSVAGPCMRSLAVEDREACLRQHRQYADELASFLRTKAEDL